MKITMEKLVAFAKTYGFIYQGSDIYGGLANTWDYGPLGVELKNNIKQFWWKKFVQSMPASYGIDASILMNSKVWEASGHVDSFSDPLIDCKKCKTRHRADTLVEKQLSIDASTLSENELSTLIVKEKIKCPNCTASDFTPIRQFNLMFATERGVTLDKQTIYLRPETAQGQYVNYLNVQRSMRAKLPFGVGQIGKAFRNEITTGNFTFRTIEFEQMEYQFFCREEDSTKFFDYFKNFARKFFVDLGVSEENLKFKDHEKLAHYAKAATDIEYKFPFGWGEINGTHNRGTFDLDNHQKCSKQSLEYTDQATNEKFIPHIVESTMGVDRLVLMLLCEAYDTDTVSDETREVLRLSPLIAPYKACVLPLIKKYHSEKALSIYESLRKTINCTYDDTGKIGRRYRRQDVIGTPFVITVDDTTLNNNIVTIRHRDSMKQIDMDVNKLNNYLLMKIQENVFEV